MSVAEALGKWIYHLYLEVCCTAHRKPKIEGVLKMTTGDCHSGLMLSLQNATPSRYDFPYRASRKSSRKI